MSRVTPTRAASCAVPHHESPQQLTELGYYVLADQSTTPSDLGSLESAAKTTDQMVSS
jgi:hypothetical protein